jgi:hypothetical protein
MMKRGRMTAPTTQSTASVAPSLATPSAPATQTKAPPRRRRSTHRPPPSQVHAKGPCRTRTAVGVRLPRDAQWVRFAGDVDLSAA